MFSHSMTMNWLPVPAIVAEPTLEAITNSTHLQMTSPRMAYICWMVRNMRKRAAYRGITCSGSSRIADAECLRSKVRPRNTNFYSI